MITRADQEYVAGRYFVGGGTRRVAGVTPSGVLAAVDLATGRIAWTSKRDVEVWGGTLATAGGLVFMGESNGWFRAYDARSGAVLWSAFCNAGVDSSPISYELDGKQYIAVAAGGSRYGTLKGNSILIFSLGN